MKKRRNRRTALTRRSSEEARAFIVARTANLLNLSGYLRTPMSEIMWVTGLKKGGIYHHFASRDALVLAAFQYALARVQTRVGKVLASDNDAKQKLIGLIRVFRDLVLDDVLRGGCPILNLAIETDDANPRMRHAARAAMAKLLSAFVRVIEEGMRRGEFSKGDARAHATRIVASLEGGVMLTTLYKDHQYVQSVADRLEAQVNGGLV